VLDCCANIGLSREWYVFVMSAGLYTYVLYIQYILYNQISLRWLKLRWA